MIFTPGGRPVSISPILAFTRSMTSRAFCPWRMMTIPETTSPSPSNSATPLRMSGPRTTVPMSLTLTGAPDSPAARTMFSMSRTERT